MAERLKVVVGLLAMIAAFNYWVYLIQTTPKDNGPKISILVFVGGSLLILVPALCLLLYDLLPRGGQRSRKTTNNIGGKAEEMALSLWRVDGQPKIMSDRTAVCLAHFSWTNRCFILTVRQGHPDMERFCQLHQGDIIELESLSRGMGCAPEHELCDYLRIKSVQSAA